MSHCINLYRNKIIQNIEPWVMENIQYESVMGSQAYGVSNDDSDLDLYAVTIPPKEVVFPHLQGCIPGFGKQAKAFNNYQQHHVEYNGKSHDLNVYNIVKYFHLVMDNNPNMIDSLFVRQQSVTHQTKIAQMIRDNRHLFLHKGAWHRFRGYAYSQLKKVKNKKPEGPRKELVEKYGYDVKFAYHLVRLLDEIEQVLEHGDIDLMRDRERLKAIRRGEFTLEELESSFYAKEQRLEQLYHTSTLPKYPDEERIKQLLIDCLEEFYGSIDDTAVRQVGEYERAVQQIKSIVGRLT